MKLNWLTLVAACLLTQTALADRPLTCPTLSAINAATDKLQVVKDRNAFAGKIFDVSLGTTFQWAVYTTDVTADNEKQAAKMIKHNIKESVLFEGPVERDNIWGCMYIQGNMDTMTLAITPPIDLETSAISKFSRHSA